MRPDRVLIAVEGGAPTGGAERVAFDTVQVLSDQGIPTTIISSADKVDPRFASLPHVDVVTLGLPLQFERFFGGGRQHMIRNLTVDHAMRAMFDELLAPYSRTKTIFHAHGFHNFFTQASLQAAIDAGLPTIVTCHDFGLTCPNATYFHYQTEAICPLTPLSMKCLGSACMGPDAVRLKQLRFARSWSFRRSSGGFSKLSRILAVSEFEQKILQRQIDRATIGVLHNPVDPASKERQRPALSKDFLWIGRMTAEKDAITPAKTCAALGVPLVFVGDGPLRKEVESVNPAAVFLGWKSGAEVKKAQCSARAMILSSKWHETASLVVLECLAAGIPCIVPSTSAATNWVQDGVNGLYFEAGNQESLAKAIVALQDDDMVEEMSQKAFYQYWSNPFTVERYSSDLLSIYSEVLAS